MEEGEEGLLGALLSRMGAHFMLSVLRPCPDIMLWRPCTVVLHDQETPASAVLSWPGPNLGAGFRFCLCLADFSLLSVSA